MYRMRVQVGGLVVEAVEGFFRSSKLHLQRESPTDHLNRLKSGKKRYRAVDGAKLYPVTALCVVISPTFSFKAMACLPIDRRGVKQLARGATSPNPNGVTDLGALMSGNILRPNAMQ